MRVVYSAEPCEKRGTEGGSSFKNVCVSVDLSFEKQALESVP